MTEPWPGESAVLALRPLPGDAESALFQAEGLALLSEAIRVGLQTRPTVLRVETEDGLVYAAIALRRIHYHTESGEERVFGTPDLWRIEADPQGGARISNASDDVLIGRYRRRSAR